MTTENHELHDNLPPNPQGPAPAAALGRLEAWLAAEVARARALPMGAESDEPEVRGRGVSAYNLIMGRVRRVWAAIAGEEARPEHDEHGALDGEIMDDAQERELRHHREHVTRLQARGTELVEENRRLREELAARGPRVCVTAFVEDDAGRLLLVHHRERGWELPGGKHEVGEMWRSALVREVHEETGLSFVCSPRRPLPIDGMPERGAPYQSLVLLAEGYASGAPRVSSGGPIDDARWFARAEVPLDGLSQLASADIVREWAKAGGANGGDWLTEAGQRAEKEMASWPQWKRDVAARVFAAKAPAVDAAAPRPVPDRQAPIAAASDAGVDALQEGGFGFPDSHATRDMVSTVVTATLDTVAARLEIARRRATTSPPAEADRPFLILSTKWSRGNNLSWWGPDRGGYTPAIQSPGGGWLVAGRYTAEEVRDICRPDRESEPVLLADALALSLVVVPADSSRVEKLTKAGWEALASNRGDIPDAMRAKTPSAHPQCSSFFGLAGSVYGPSPNDRCDACHRLRGEHDGPALLTPPAEMAVTTVEPWTPKVGERVRTAEKLTDNYSPVSWPHRRPGAAGRIAEYACEENAWMVHHDDGTTAPYDADELRPEKR